MVVLFVVLFIAVIPWVILGVAKSYDKAEEWYCGTKGLLPAVETESITKCGSPLPEYPREV